MDKRYKILEQKLSKDTLEEINQKFENLYNKLQDPERQKRTTEALDIDNSSKNI